MKNSTYFLAIVLWMMSYSHGQAQDNNLLGIANLWQSNSLNPAKMTNQKFTFALPGLSVNLGTGGLTYTDLVSTNEEGEKVIVANQLIEQLSDNNRLYAMTEIPTFSMAYGNKNWQVSIGHAVKSDNAIQFPKELAQMTLQGNQQFLNQTVDIGPSFSLQSYSEWALGTAIQFNSIKVGVKLKLLGGHYSLSSTDNKAEIYTNGEGIYEMNLSADYKIQSGGLLKITGLEGSQGDVEIDIEDLETSDILLGKNKGFAFDIGVEIPINDKFVFSGSVIDIGSISWSQNAEVYNSKGDYSYDGLDFVKFAEEEEVDFDEIIDTLTSIFQFDKQSTNFNSSTTLRSYWTGKYIMSDKLDLGAFVSTRHAHNSLLPTLGAFVQFQAARWWSVGINTSYSKVTRFSAGLNSVIHFGPVQFFFMSDNLAGLIVPTSQSHLQTRLGLNLAFGKRQGKEQEMEK